MSPIGVVKKCPDEIGATHMKGFFAFFLLKERSYREASNERPRLRTGTITKLPAKPEIGCPPSNGGFKAFSH